MKRSILVATLACACATVAGVGVAAPGRDAAAAPCSAGSLRPVRPVAGLPARIATMRLRIAEAARRCDYAELVRLGNAHGRGLAFSFGGTTDAAAYWRQLERSSPRPRPMEALVKLLSLPHATVAANGRLVPTAKARFFVWPRAHRLHPSLGDWRALRILYTQAQIDAMRKSGIGYSGYRVGITRSGDWQYFIAGD